MGEKQECCAMQPPPHTLLNFVPEGRKFEYWRKKGKQLDVQKGIKFSLSWFPKLISMSAKTRATYVFVTITKFNNYKT